MGRSYCKSFPEVRSKKPPTCFDFTHESMPAETFTFINSRGQALDAVACLPPGGAAACRAVLVFLHGYSEHTGRKLHVFEQLAAAGVGVYAYDMAGHGRSQPQDAAGRALLLDWHHLVDDACGFAYHVRQQHAAATSSHLNSSNSNVQPPMSAATAPGSTCVPWLLGGYSIGALTAVHAVVRQQGQWSGLVMVSASLGLHTHGLLTRVQAALGGLMNATLPRRKLVKGLVTQHLNPDPDWVSDYDADPLVYHDKARVCMVYQFGQAIEALQRINLKQQLLPPTYVLHATADQVTQYEAAHMFAADVPGAELATVEGGCHDLLSTANSQRHVAAIAGWILRSCSTLNQ